MEQEPKIELVEVVALWRESEKPDKTNRITSYERVCRRIATQELTVITKAKDLCGYVLNVTEKSPKRFRFTLVSRIQNLVLDIIEQAYRANEIYTAGPGQELARQKRLDLQHAALTSAKLLCYMALLCREQGCILPKQYEQITKLASDVQNLLGAWIVSDRKRFSQ